MRTLMFFLIAPILLIGCKSATDKVKEDFMPTARGEADEIILVMDSAQWEGPLGDAMKEIYQQYMKVLNQDEYEFSLNKVNPRKLNSVFRNAKNLIFLMTLDSKTLESQTIRNNFTDKSLKMIQKDSSIYYSVRRDEFAKGQIVLYLFGQNEELLLKHIRDNREGLKDLYATAVTERVKESVLAKTQKQKIKAITEDHGYEVQVPFGWDIANSEDDFLWLRKLEAQTEQNVFIYEGKFNDPDFYQHIDELRDKITGTYLRDSQKPELFIQRQEIIPIYTRRITFKGKFAVEARGLWKISDNSAGGPFVSYTFVDEPNQKLYYIEGYIYAPGTKKKRLIREVDAVLNTFVTPSELDKNPS